MNKQKARHLDKAAALTYSGSGAPRVVAKGQGEVAKQIESVAAREGVPIIQDMTLTELLCEVPLGDEIPHNLFYAVAEVLAHIYRVRESIDSHQ